jgi:hypothetical protein
MMPFRTLGSIILLFFFGASLWANDCTTATNVAIGGNYTVAFDGTADFAGSQQDPCPNAPLGDAWFKWVPGGTNANQANIEFNITTSFNGVFDVYLLYSESFELGDPCEYPGAGGSGNLTGLTRYKSSCGVSISGLPADIFEFENLGLDGSGEFYLVVEWVSGAGGTVSVNPQLTGTCPAPANDACANPITLSLGNGIDSNYGASAGPAWSDSYCGSIQCATKERFTSDCPAGSGVAAPTEDHYARRLQIGWPFNIDTCGFVGKVGDTNGTFIPNTINSCDTWLENTVWYSFTAPSDASLYSWQLHLGANSFCAQQPNDLVVMLLTNVDCSDADVASRVDCEKIPIGTFMPNIAGTLDGNLGLGFGLNNNQTYYIVVDGTRSSQCDFCLLLTTSFINPVLPATVETFGARNEGPVNVLNWETSEEMRHDYFGIERSLDGENFENIGRVNGVGESTVSQYYQFDDRNAPFGQAYYRLKIVDNDGKDFFSSVIEVVREEETLALHEAYPVPFQESLNLYYSTPSDLPLNIRMIDIHGRVVLRKQFTTRSGTQELILDTQSLSAGMYVLQMEQDGRTVSRKVVK